MSAAAAQLGPVGHSALGASSAERWTTCYGSARMTASLPAQAHTIYSREGTRAHALAQHCLEKAIRKCKKFVGASVPGLDDDLTKVTEDMAAAVQLYLDTVYGLLDLNPGAKLFIEQKFKLPFIGPDIDGSDPGGTNDACIYYPNGFIDLIDYKHGAGKFVEVKGNKQLKYYALGAQTFFAKLGIKITGARMTIVQPRCTQADEPVRSETITLEGLWDFKEDLIVAASECRKPNAPCVAGPWCKGTWCAGALQMACEAFKDAALKGLVEAPRAARSAGTNGALIPAVELPSAAGPLVPVAKGTALVAQDFKREPVETTPDPKLMSRDELGFRLKQAVFLSNYLACLTEYAKSEAAAGRMPTGWGWKRGRGSRIWAKKDKEILAALQQQTNAGDFVKTTLVSVAQAEKIVGKAAFAKSSELKALWEKVPGGPVLAQLADIDEPFSGVIELEPVEIGD